MHGGYVLTGLLLGAAGIGALVQLEPETPDPLPPRDPAPYIAERHALSPDEELAIIRVPDPLVPEVPAADAICLRYFNRATGTVAFECPMGVPPRASPAP